MKGNERKRSLALPEIILELLFLPFFVINPIGTQPSAGEAAEKEVCTV
jgi:hypothetical protein